MTKKEEKTTEDKKGVEMPKFTGKFISTVGRRKTSVARVRLYTKGNGSIVVNEQKLSHLFSVNESTIVKSPLKLTSHLRDLNFSIMVNGGGLRGKAEAIRHGISRALIKLDEELRLPLKAKGWMSRDPRSKERKKPGLKKARRAPQWSKR